MSHQQDPAAASAPLLLRASRATINDRGATRFAFEPARIEVTEGERIKLVVKSGDGVHGIEIKKFRVNKKVPRGGDGDDRIRRLGRRRVPHSLFRVLR